MDVSVGDPAIERNADDSVSSHLSEVRASFASQSVMAQVYSARSMPLSRAKSMACSYPASA